MADSTAADPNFLREAELRLLRCTLPSPASPAPPPSLPPPHPLGPVATSALAAVEAGDYAAALASAAPHLLPASVSTVAPDSAAQFYADLAAAAQAFLRGDDEGLAGEGFECRCAVVLSAAVAALLAFAQQNVTGLHLDSAQEACGLHLSHRDSWFSNNTPVHCLWRTSVHEHKESRFL